MTKRTELIGPHVAYSVRRDLAADGPCMTAIDHGHCPSNKRHGQVKSTAEFEVMASRDWVQYRLEETTTYPNGRISGRSISITLPRDQAEAIARHILKPRTLANA